MSPFLNLHSLAAGRGEGLRPELRALFERLAIPQNGLTLRSDGMVQSGPDPISAQTIASPERIVGVHGKAELGRQAVSSGLCHTAATEGNQAVKNGSPLGVCTENLI
jgi:hypothetical protein